MILVLLVVLLSLVSSSPVLLPLSLSPPVSLPVPSSPPVLLPSSTFSRQTNALSIPSQSLTPSSTILLKPKLKNPITKALSFIKYNPKRTWFQLATLKHQKESKEKESLDAWIDVYSTMDSFRSCIERNCSIESSVARIGTVKMDKEIDDENQTVEGVTKGEGKGKEREEDVGKETSEKHAVKGKSNADAVVKVSKKNEKDSLNHKDANQRMNGFQRGTDIELKRYELETEEYKDPTSSLKKDYLTRHVNEKVDKETDPSREQENVALFIAKVAAVKKNQMNSEYVVAEPSLKEKEDVILFIAKVAAIKERMSKQKPLSIR